MCMCCYSYYRLFFLSVDWLVVFYVTSTARSSRDCPYLLSLSKDVKLGKYTVPTGNRTPGLRVAVHYAIAAPRKLHFPVCICNIFYEILKKHNQFMTINLIR